MSAGRAVALLLVAAVSSKPLDAQPAVGAQRELRLDVLATGGVGATLGGGVNWPAGTYTRIGVGLAGGLASRDAREEFIARGEVIGRFHLDPFAESRRGLYGFAGGGVEFARTARWSEYLVAGLGLEGRRQKGRVVALELGLGRGLRVGVSMRSARRIGR